MPPATHLLLAGPKDLPFAKAHMEGGAGELRLAIGGRALDDDDIDCACEGGGVDFLVVLVGRGYGADRAAKVVHRCCRHREGHAI